MYSLQPHFFKLFWEVLALFESQRDNNNNMATLLKITNAIEHSILKCLTSLAMTQIMSGSLQKICGLKHIINNYLPARKTSSLHYHVWLVKQKTETFNGIVEH